VIGNPYFGLRVGAPLGSFDVEVGYRPRVVKPARTWPGGTTLDLAAREGDFDRFEAFSSANSTVRTAVTGTARLSPNISLRGRLALTFFPGGDGVNAVATDAGGAVAFAGRRLGLSAALSVRKPKAFGNDPSSVQAALAASYAAGMVTPSLYVRIPLQEAMTWYGLRSARYVVGVGVTVALEGARSTP
jgi:hypothetical protein